VKKRFKPLLPPNSIHLNAAEGWIELGDIVSANDELEAISAEFRAHPAVLLLRYEIYARAKKWDLAAEVACALTELLPENPDVWIYYAYSTRRKTDGGISSAKDILLKMQPKFPRDYRFSFNLGCYCSQLKHFDEAEKWLKKAIVIDDMVQKLILSDEDLKPFLDSMSGTLWKKE